MLSETLQTARRRQPLRTQHREQCVIRVLIVDDELIMRQGLRYMIRWEEEGFEIVGEATNGEEALTLIEERKPHIVITDIVMPVLDGVDFTDVVRSRYPEIQIIILSGYDKYDYVRRTMVSGAVDYILKPTLNPDQLREVLKKAAERIPGVQMNVRETGVRNPETSLARFLLGHDPVLDRKPIEDRLSGDRYLLFGVDIRVKDSHGTDLSGTLFKKIDRTLPELPESAWIRVLLREEIICILFSYAVSGRRSIHEFIQRLAGQLSILNSAVLCIQSGEFEDLSTLREIYRNSIQANAEKAFYYKNTHLLLTETLPKGDGKRPRFDFPQFSQALSHQRYEEASDMIRAYAGAGIESRMDIESLRNQVRNVLYYYLDSLKTDEDQKEEWRYHCFREITNARYAEDFSEALEEALREIQALASDQSSATDELVKKMLAYIQEHYTENLTLEMLADRFGFSYHYLSAYFSQQMHEGFSDYVTGLRIDKACELLKNPALSIADVSGMVGYSEHSYFCRVFKKVTGKTPSAWRRG